ncbi:hypothetical protein SDC9_147681 [bioreactor metagenome]|uniref:Uncharacterized protein n=1 Tax=bioreactor metagenome TaxID=1076179 RepID=A0A645EGB7_9ZZZZ
MREIAATAPINAVNIPITLFICSNCFISASALYMSLPLLLCLLSSIFRTLFPAVSLSSLEVALISIESIKLSLPYNSCTSVTGTITIAGIFSSSPPNISISLFITPMIKACLGEFLGPTFIVLPTTSSYPKSFLAAISSTTITDFPSMCSLSLKNLPYTISKFLTYCNSSLPPVIYALLDSLSDVITPCFCNVGVIYFTEDILSLI